MELLPQLSLCKIVECFCFVWWGAPLDGRRSTTFCASLAFLLMDTHNSRQTAATSATTTVDGDFVCTTDAWAHFSVVYFLLRFQNGGHCRQVNVKCL